MKKIILMFFLMIMIINNFGCANQETETDITPSLFIKTNIDEIEKALNNSSDMIVYYGKEYCGSCISMESKLEQVMELLKLDIHYLNSDLVKNEEFLKKYNIELAPSIIFIKSGNLFVYEGDISFEILLNVFKIYSEKGVIPERLKNISEIEYEELLKKLDIENDFLLYIGRPDCPDCQNFVPLLKEYIDENEYSGVYYLDIKKFRDAANIENASEQNIKFYDDLKNKFNIEWVPSMYHIKKDEIISKYEYLNKEYYELDNNEKLEMEEKFKYDFSLWMKSELQY